MSDQPGDEPDAERAGLAGGALVATVVLGAITGYVDSFAYVYLFATFPANQSGNVALLGIALGQGEWGAALTCFVSIGGFALGVASGVLLVSPRRSAHHLAPRRTRVVLLIEMGVLAVVAVAVGALGEGHQVMEGPAALALLAATAFAMGVQTPVIMRTHGVPTPTTYMSGSVTHMAEAFVQRLPRRGGLLAVVLAGYVAGAALGTTVGSVWNLGLVVPAVALALLLVVRRVKA